MGEVLQPKNAGTPTRRCAVCAADVLPLVSEAWFFVGSPEGCNYVCSLECLVNLVGTLAQKARRGPPPPTHTIQPHRRE